MAAALRALRRIPARLIPSALPGPLPKLYDAAVSAAASSLPSTHCVNSSPRMVSSVLRRYCSAPLPVLPGTAIGLAPVRQAYSSPLQVPSPMPMRHHGCTKFNSLQQCSDEEAARFVLEKLQDIDKTLEQLKRVLVLQALLVVLFLHLLFRKVAAVGEKVGKLQRRRY